MPIGVLTVRTLPVKGKMQFLSPESGASGGMRIYLNTHALVSQVTVVGRG